MSGKPIESVKETMQIFLRSLPFNTRFNIVGFGSNHVKLFPDSVHYNDDTLAKAAAHVCFRNYLSHVATKATVLIVFKKQYTESADRAQRVPWCARALVW